MKNILKAIKSVLRGFDNKLNKIENQIEKSISDAVKTMTGASDTEDGKAGIVPAPKAGQQDLPLCGDGQYKMLPQADYTQNDSTKPDFIKHRPGGYIDTIEEPKLHITAEKVANSDELTNVVVQDESTIDYSTSQSLSVTFETASGNVHLTLQQRQIPEYVINMYGANIFGNAHLIAPSQPDTGEAAAIYKELDTSSNYSTGWHVWFASAEAGSVTVSASQKTDKIVKFPHSYIPWEESPTAESVLYTYQSLTDSQKEWARKNIGAEKVLTPETWTFTLEDDTTVTKEVYVK